MNFKTMLKRQFLQVNFSDRVSEQPTKPAIFMTSSLRNSIVFMLGIQHVRSVLAQGTGHSRYRLSLQTQQDQTAATDFGRKDNNHSGPPHWRRTPHSTLPCIPTRFVSGNHASYHHWRRGRCCNGHPLWLHGMPPSLR